MPKFAAPARVEPRLLQLEVPLSGTVGVVDKHEVRVVLQALGLVFHRLAILLDEFREYKLQEIRGEGQPEE